MSFLTPFTCSEEANLYQIINPQRPSDDHADRSNRERRRLSSKIATASTVALFLSNLSLFLVLRFHASFKYDKNIILEKDATIQLLQTFLLPMAGITMLANVFYRKSRSKYKHYNEESVFDFHHVYAMVYGSISNSMQSLRRLLSMVVMLVSCLILSIHAIVAIAGNDNTIVLGTITD